MNETCEKKPCALKTVFIIIGVICTVAAAAWALKTLYTKMRAKISEMCACEDEECCCENEEECSCGESCNCGSSDGADESKADCGCAETPADTQAE